MIFKIGDRPVDLKPYTCRHCPVYAALLKEDALVETLRGWREAKRGDWIVKLGLDIWIVLNAQEFEALYLPGLESALCG